MAGRHKGDTKEFGELDFAEQAKSLSAQIMNLQAAIDHHIKHSNRADTANKCKGQVERLLDRLKAKYP